MKTETIIVTRESGTTITLSFDAANLIQNTGFELRIPVQLGTYPRVVLLQAFKAHYRTAEDFLARIEQFGKQQVSQWLQNSQDGSITMLPYDMKHGWGISFENLEEPIDDS